MNNHEIPEVDDFVEVVGYREPPLRLNPTDILEQGKRRRRKRRVSTALVGGLLVAGALSLSAQIDVGTWRTEATPTATSQVEKWSPDDLEKSILRAAQPLTQTGWQEARVEALDFVGRPIGGQDRDKATRWKATFSDSSEHTYEVRLLHQSGGLKEGVGLAENCSLMLKAGHALTCTTEADGAATVQDVVRWVGFRDETWVWLTPEQVQEGPGVWLEQTVRRYSENGEAAVAIHRWRAEGQAWQDEVDTSANRELREHLYDIAADPSLVFPAPPADSCGGWVIEEERARRGC